MIQELKNLPDVSFIGDVTLKDIEDSLVRDYEEKYFETTGEKIILARADPVTLLLYACAVQFYQGYKYIDKAGKMDLLKYAYGPYLDHIASMKGITREQAKPARVMVRFTLSEVRPNTIEIPQGTQVTDGSMYFETEQYAEIKPGSGYIDVECVCLVSGSDGNDLQPGEINTLVNPIPYVASVSNIEETAGGVDIEDDDSMKERVYIAPSSYSVAGPEDAYRYWVKTFNSGISDVLVQSDNPVDVIVEFIMSDGELPTTGLIQGLQLYLQNKQIRPLTDKVTVKAPDTVDYKLDVRYYINTSDLKRADTIKANVNAAVEQYIVWQRSKIGRDINPSQLIQMMVSAGAKRVEVKLPVFQVVGAANVAKLVSQTVTYGGIEDD